MLGLGLSLSSFKTVRSNKITILHTNDAHHIDPFPADDLSQCDMGGV
jgi:5'-nucleotidase